MRYKKHDTMTMYPFASLVFPLPSVYGHHYYTRTLIVKLLSIYNPPDASLTPTAFTPVLLLSAQIVTPVPVKLLWNSLVELFLAAEWPLQRSAQRLLARLWLG